MHRMDYKNYSGLKRTLQANGLSICPHILENANETERYWLTSCKLCVTGFVAVLIEIVTGFVCCKF